MKFLIYLFVNLLYYLYSYIHITQINNNNTNNKLFNIIIYKRN